MTLGFTACNDDDEYYATTAEMNAEKIRSLNITKAHIHFTDQGTSPDDGIYDVSIDGNFLVLKYKDEFYQEINITYYVPLEQIKYILYSDYYHYYDIYIF